MGKAKKAASQANADAPDPNQAIPDAFGAKLRKLVVQNFGCIGTTPVEIDLDDIVVLVGPNNTGKSTILRAYHVVFSSSEPKLKIDDFPELKLDPDNLPTIELHTAVNANPPGHRWIANVDGENIIRERWRWAEPDQKAKRQGFDVLQGDWANEVPWGAANVANSRRPKPHRIEAFAKPEDQAKEVTELLLDILKSSVKQLPTTAVSPDGQEEPTEYGRLLQSLGTVQKSVVDQAQQQISAAEARMTEFVGEVFQGYRVQFDARPEDNLAECLNFFKAGAKLRMGPSDGHLSTVDRQGSGARRTVMWAALQYAAEAKGDGDSQQYLLLLDEPELCLHPNAIREACRVLYDLPANGKWQVMVTTHSPVFIDLSRDNTTVVRVERTLADKQVRGTTVFRPEKVNLSEDEKELLKLLNVCDPHLAEFFFGGRTVLVEGDTEYTAFKYVMSKDSDDPLLRDVHVVRARGKATISLLAKILNQSNASYGVLHDSDRPTITTKKGKTINNPAWTGNTKIIEAVAGPLQAGRVRLLTLIPNFEAALLGEEAEDEKPFNAWDSLRKSEELAERVRQLLHALVDFTKPVPVFAFQWNDVATLKAEFDKRTAN